MAKDPIDKRYIRVKEPWGGGHTPYDTGFGNRLLHWDACYVLESVSSTDHFLQLEHKYWHETEYLEFPGDKLYKLEGMEDEITDWLAHYDFDYDTKTITKIPSIDNAEIENFLDTVKLKDYDLPESKYVVDFDWGYIEKILKKADKRKIPTGLNRVKIKDHQLRSAIRQIATGCVGLHIRRGNGVYKTNKNYKELPESVRENIQYTQVDDTIYKYWEDSKYAALIKEILEQTPNQKFYISCDLLEKEYIHLKTKFNARIFTRRDVIDSLPSYLTRNVNFEDVNCSKRIALESVIDMMCLAGSNFIVGAPHSTWLSSIQRMRPVPYAFINEGKDRILRRYVKSLNTYSTLV